MAYNLGKSATERACAISWFSNWSRDQKITFLDRLLQKKSLQMATESLLADLDRMTIGGCGNNQQQQQEGPSVFQCQLR